MRRGDQIEALAVVAVVQAVRGKRLQAVLAGVPPEESGTNGTTNGAAMRIAPTSPLVMWPRRHSKGRIQRGSAF